MAAIYEIQGDHTFEFYEAIEDTFLEILDLVGHATDQDRVPGRGPDHPEDVVAVLVSSEYRRLLDLPFLGYGSPLWEKVGLLSVKVIEFPPLATDYEPLLRCEASQLFEGLASAGLAEGELEVAERLLATFETIEAPYADQLDLLREAVAAAAPGELDGPWPAA